MNLSPTTGGPGGRGLGHRRAHSSALDIVLPTKDEQELEINQPLLEEKLEQKIELLEEKLEERGTLSTFTNPRRHATIITLWVLSMVAASLCTYLATKSAQKVSLGTFSHGYVTDLRDARSAILTQVQQLYGSLDFHGHHGFIPENSPSLRYVGTTPAVDAAWEELSKDRYFLLSDKEARESYGDSIEKYWNVHHGGYVAGLDVLHTLHCLNHLRMSLYPDVYPQDPGEGSIHKAHCIDHLRQLAMCHADLTPVPTQYFEGLERNYINSSREHTCRDFTRVRAWATERFNGSTAVKPRNRDGTPREEFYAPWGP